jgi:hypothetical protein
MHIPQLNGYDTEPHQAAVKSFIQKNRKEFILREIQELVNDELCSLEDNAAYHLACVASNRAEEFYERLLSGDAEAAIQLFGGDKDRYKQLGCDAGEPWAHLIHGRLFQTRAMEMRQKIVEAHADLIRNERIKDLESIVDGLQRQIISTQAELERTRERLR